MPRPNATSKLTEFNPRQLARFRDGMTTRHIQILTGWSRATVYRRMQEPDFPAAIRDAAPKLWETEAIVEWIAKFNLRSKFGYEVASEFEETLAAEAQFDSALQTAAGRTTARIEAIRDPKRLTLAKSLRSLD